MGILDLHFLVREARQLGQVMTTASFKLCIFQRLLAGL